MSDPVSSSSELLEFLEKIAAGRDGVPISIDEAQEISGRGRAAVLKRFRDLQAIGEGYLRLGRHGHPTRFYFRSASSGSSGARKAKAATRLKQDPAPIAEVVSGPPPATSIEHIFQLRGDASVSLTLPADLTDREAMRLAKFIESLPF